MCGVIGKTVIVYDRYLFAVPVKGKVVGVSENDGAYKVEFFINNPGGHNVNKHDGAYFLPRQCEICEEYTDLSKVSSDELINELRCRLVAVKE